MESPSRLWQRLRAAARRRDVTEAVLTAVVGLVLIALGVVDVSGLPWALPAWLSTPWVHAALLVLGCLCLLGKRYHPVSVAVAVVCLFVADQVLGGSLGMYLVLFDALYHLILFCPRPWIRPAIGAIAVPVTLVPVAVYVATGDLRSASMTLIMLFAILGTPAWWALSVRQQSELTELASARAEDLRRLADLSRARAVQDERARMAQDLHDALSSHLSTIAIHSGATLATDGRGPGPTAEEQRAALREIRTASVRALDDLREMILLLRTGQDEIAPAAHLRDIEPLVIAARGTGLQVSVTTDLDGLPRLPSVVDQAGYRIVQESLANAAKHAPGGTVEVTIDVHPGEVHVLIGCRPGPTAARRPRGSGLGLTSMRDRATALGGTLEAGWDDDGRVWTVRTVLPLEGKR